MIKGEDVFLYKLATVIGVTLPTLKEGIRVATAQFEADEAAAKAQPIQEVIVDEDFDIDSHNEQMLEKQAEEYEKNKAQQVSDEATTPAESDTDDEDYQGN